MTHYWIQTWQGLCVYYITRHWAHLSFITYITPPHQGGEKGKWEGKRKGQRGSWPELCTEVTSPSRSDWYSAVSSPSHTSPFLFYFSPYLSPFPSFCAGNLLNITTPESAMEHPRRSCPQGFFGEILETHHRGHSSLLPSHFNRLDCVDLRFVD